MNDPDSIFTCWTGMIDNDFTLTVQQTFRLSPTDDYKYRVEAFSMTLSEVQEALKSDNYHYWYAHEGQRLEAPPADITAYTTIFSPHTSPRKSLISFAANARKLSPRASVATYLLSRRLLPPALIVAKVKPSPLPPQAINPYYDIWVWTCHETGFLGPLDQPAYADPAGARVTHPVLPVLYHFFGCVCPSWEALGVVAQLAERGAVEGKGGWGKRGGGEVLEMASGNGYWTYLLRRMGVRVTAVDSGEAVWRMQWIRDTVVGDGVEYLRRHGGAKGMVLLMVYMVPRGEFTKRVLREYKGETVVVVGTQNANRFTGFEDMTVEEYFEREKGEFEMTVRIALPSFAGKDEALYVYQRKK